MAEIRKLPIAHIVNNDPIELHSHNLIEMLEHGQKNNFTGITFLDRRNKETKRNFKDLLDGARIVANYLKNRGLKRGDKVIVLLVTSESFTDAFFGTIMAGGIPVPASPPMTFGDVKKYLTNLSHIIKNSQARYLITFPRIRKVIGEVLADNNDLKEVILSKDIVDEKPKVPGFPSIDTDFPAFFQYTSGTTSLPKGAVLSHRALLSNIYGIHQGIECGPSDVCVSWLPLFHDMGLIGSMLTALYSGAHLIGMLPESFLMDPAGWLKNNTSYKGTIAVAPNFAYHLCANRVTDEEMSTLDLSSLKVALNGAEPVDLKTLRAFEKKFSKVGYKNNVNFPVYGMAENCLAATFPELRSVFQVEPLDRVKLEVDQLVVDADPDDPAPYQAVSVGRPITGQQVAISANGKGFAKEREVGEIVIKSPSLTDGYYRNSEDTNKVLKDGWLHTGDLGFIKNGQLYITGRAKEMIIKRGRNYYPYDIERAAARVEGVRKGCLVAFANHNDETGTEDLVLVVETRETDSNKIKQMEQSVGGEVLSVIGIKPDNIVFVPPRSIPKTSSGKLQRLLCRQRYIEGSLVKGLSERWLTPMKTVVGSFIGNQRFRMRVRTP
jgi:acyl-CoA synthetase (AMP-forming)/AMP-acid ligase II